MLCYVLLFLGIVSLWWHWRARVRMKVTNLTGKYTFITGCDTEFGNTAAKIFDKNGFRVFASSLTETGAKKLKAVSLRQLQTALLDVRDSESVKKVAAWVKAEVQSEGECQDIWAACLLILGLSCPSEFCFTIAFHNLPQGNCLTTRDSFTPTAFLFLFASHIVMFVLTYCRCWLPVLRAYRPGFAMTVPQLKVTRLFLGSVISQGHYGWGLAPHKLLQILVFTEAAKKQKPPTICFNKDISPVVQCMEHALTSLHPHAHSIAGQDAKLLWNPLSRMPGVIQDFLLLRSRVELAVSHAK
ncbi:DHRS9 reductase, partial [Steatornis caripensis]|nr:DHRS9 reductase [Steatornis caripensis]